MTFQAWISAAVSFVQQTLDGLGDLPLPVHLLVGGGFVAGMILWLAGGRVIQPAFVVLGSLAGAAAGTLVAPTLLGPTVAGVPAVYAGVGAGAILGFVVGLALFRLAMAASAGAVFAAVGVLAALIILGRHPGALPEGLSSIQQAELSIQTSAIEIREELRALTGDQAGKIHVFAERAFEHLKAWWAATPEQSRQTLLLALGGGLVLGVLLGLAAPKKSAMLVTALAGSGAMLACGVWLLNATSPDLASKIPWTPIVTASVWGGLVLLGLGVQWQHDEKPPAPKPAPQAA